MKDSKYCSCYTGVIIISHFFWGPDLIQIYGSLERQGLWGIVWKATQNMTMAGCLLTIRVNLNF